MYLTIKKNRGNEYLQMMESYLDPETGHPGLFKMIHF